jgi:hypothetical protein
MEFCYCCGKKFDSVSVLKHEEHIIQQSIGGRLKCNDILCKNCGEKLGHYIDAPFGRIFSDLCAFLDIKKDRNGARKSVKGVIVSENDRYGNCLNGVDVVWKNSKVFPVRPIHKYSVDKSKVFIYAKKKSLRNYIKKVESELDCYFPAENRPELVTCDDIECYFNFNFNIDEEVLSSGLVKMAIGYASSLGIDRKYLNLVFDFDRSEIKKGIRLLPFTPKGILDRFIENNEHKFRYYPSHTLILFTSYLEPSAIIFYVELFSTFKFYIIMGDGYCNAPFYHGYTQSLGKESFIKYTPDKDYHKIRESELLYYSISESKIDKEYEAQRYSKNAKKREEIEYELIENEINKRKYSLDFEEELEAIIGHSISELRNIESTNIVELVKNMRLFYGANDKRGEFFRSYSYRRFYIENNIVRDYISSLNDFYCTDEGEKIWKKYGHFKYYKLSNFSQLKNLKEKASTEY